MMTTALQMHDVARANNAIDVVMVVTTYNLPLHLSDTSLLIASFKRR